MSEETDKQKANASQMAKEAMTELETLREALQNLERAHDKKVSELRGKINLCCSKLSAALTFL